MKYFARRQGASRDPHVVRRCIAWSRGAGGLAREKLLNVLSNIRADQRQAQPCGFESRSRLGEWICVPFFLQRCFFGTESASEREEWELIEARGLISRRAFSWRKRGFWRRQRFSSFSYWMHQRDFDGAVHQWKGESIIWSSFLCVTDFQSILYFGNLEIVLFLSRPCRNQG